MESAIHTKSVKNNFVFIQCAAKERLKHNQMTLDAIVTID